MTNWRIKHRLLALALLPSMVVAMVLTGYWTAIKIMELNRQLEERGETIVAFLAPAAEYGVLSGNRAYLRSASTRVREEQDLISIRVSDDRDNLLYTHVRDIQDSRRLHTLSALLFGHEVRQFEAPIVLTSLDGFDFLGGSAEVDRRNTERVIGHVRISLSTVPTAVTQTEWLLRSLVIIVVLLALTGLVIYRLEQPISAPWSRWPRPCGVSDAATWRPAPGSGQAVNWHSWPTASTTWPRTSSAPTPGLRNASSPPPGICRISWTSSTRKTVN